MAAAFPSGENSRQSRGALSYQRSAAQGQPAATGSDGTRGNRLLQSRLSAISSRESLYRLSSATSSPRNIGSAAPRGEGGIGGIGSMLASIMSLGSAALPASMAVSTPSMTSSNDGSVVGRMAEAVGRGPRERSASLPRMSSSSRSLGIRRVGVEDTEDPVREGGRSGAAVAPAAVQANAHREASGAHGSAPDNASAMENQASVSSSASVSTPSGRPIVPTTQKHVYLEGGSAVYTCAVCRAHLATRDHVVSECFHGHGGRAFLFERCVNVTAGRPEDRMLMTGMHVVADISCASCGSELGWKYEVAAEKSQKYKEGKFILERCAVTLEGCEGDARYGRGSDASNIIGWGADTAPFADSVRW